ncbi:MAG: beta-galactosidase [bacterium]
MRKDMFVGLVVILAVCSYLNSAQGENIIHKKTDTGVMEENLIPNPGFEKNILRYDGKFTTWKNNWCYFFKPGGGGQFELSKDSHSGERSLKLIGDNNESRIEVTSPFIKCKGEIQLRGYCKVSGETRPVIQIHTFDAVIKKILSLTPKSHFRYCEVAKRSEWQEFNYTIALPPEVEGIVLRLKASGKGAVFYDAIECIPIIPAEDMLSIYSLKRSIGPTIDGNLEDDCWKDAQQAVEFLVLGEKIKSDKNTWVKTCYDDENIYFAAYCKEPNVEKILIKPDAVWGGDCIELFLDTKHDHKQYSHIIVDAAANYYTGMNKDSTEGRIDIKIKTKAKISKEDHYWAIELAIPFKELNEKVPDDGQRWGFNAGRESYATAEGLPEQVVSSWASIPLFERPQSFGHIIFTSNYNKREEGAESFIGQDLGMFKQMQVSGYKIAQTQESKLDILPDIWSYDPYSVETGNKPGRNFRMLKEKHPEFIKASLRYNQSMINKALLDDVFFQAKRVFYYGGLLKLKDLNGYKDKISQHEKKMGNLELELNNIYHIYGKAYKGSYNTELLNDYYPLINKLDQDMKDMTSNLNLFIDSLQKAAKKQYSGLNFESNFSLENHNIPPFNPDGTLNRLLFLSHGGFKHEVSIVDKMMKLTDGSEIGYWPVLIPDSKGPGDYDFSTADKYIKQIRDTGIKSPLFASTAFGIYTSMMPIAPWFIEKHKDNDDIFFKSEDGYQNKDKSKNWKYCYYWVNYYNHDVQDYIRDHLGSFVRKFKDSDFLFYLTAWESKWGRYKVKINNKEVERQYGYSKSGRKAFSEYLQKKYITIDNLNNQWKTTYKTFTEISPPADRNIIPVKIISPIIYEFECFHRDAHLDYFSLLYKIIKANDPSKPVMTDDSYTMREMGGYEIFSRDITDIISFHSNPQDQEMMRVYCNSLNRYFPKIIGIAENQWGRDTRQHLGNDKSARHEAAKYIYRLTLWGGKIQDWWGSFTSAKYLTVYNGNFFHPLYDLTTMRYCSAAIPVMIQKMRHIEKFILDSEVIEPKIAVLQPTTTVIDFFALGIPSIENISINMMIECNQLLFRPKNYNFDYIPEELILDGKEDLKRFNVILLPYAIYFPDGLESKLKRWVENGGVLISSGPFGLYNRFGFYNEKNLFGTVFPGMKIDEKKQDTDWKWMIQEEKLNDGLQLVQRKFGKGKIIFMNRPINEFLRNEEITASLYNIIDKAIGGRLVYCKNDKFDLLVKTDKQKNKYVCICNRDVEHEQEGAIFVKGQYNNLQDIVIPGGFPVPSKKFNEKYTQFNVRLQPGEFTIIKKK